MFIKDEPHSEKKINEGRFRLIHNLSLVDQVVDKLIFMPWFGSEVRAPMNVTSKAGWAPLPGGYQRMALEFPFDQSVAVDKQAWDVTFIDYLIRCYVDMKLGQCVDPDKRYEWLIWTRLFYVLGPGSRFRLSNGVEYRQTFWGFMKSGWLLTLSLNSAAQAFQHALAWLRMGVDIPLPHIWGMGDDTLIRMNPALIPEYETQLSTTGCIVKKIHHSREFSGFELQEDGLVVPLYPDKHQFLMRYMEADVEQDTLLAYSLLYALAGPSWFDKFSHEVNCSKLTRIAWAKGLVHLDLLETLPSWTE